jgi:hypothetical protein
MPTVFKVVLLHSLSPGELLDVAFQQYRDHFLCFVRPIILTVVMIISVMAAIQLWGNAPISWLNMMPIRPDIPIEVFHLPYDDGYSWKVILVAICNLLLYLLPQILLTNLMVTRVAYIYLTPLTNDLPVYDPNLQRSLAIIPSVLVLVPIIVLYALIVDVINNISLIFLELLQRTDSPFIILIESINEYGFPLLLCFVLVAAIIRFICAPQVVILERCSPLKSLQRSWQLTYGSFWRVMMLVLAISFWTALLVALPSIVGGFVAYTAQAYNQDALNIVALTLARATSQVFAALAFPLPIIVSTLLYYDQRVRVEAFDVAVSA